MTHGHTDVTHFFREMIYGGAANVNVATDVQCTLTNVHTDEAGEPQRPHNLIISAPQSGQKSKLEKLGLN